MEEVSTPLKDHLWINTNLSNPTLCESWISFFEFGIKEPTGSKTLSSLHFMTLAPQIYTCHEKGRGLFWTWHPKVYHITRITDFIFMIFIS